MIESVVKPIFDEMGIFEGKEVPVKEVFDKYLVLCPDGIGPLSLFMGIVSRSKLDIRVKEVGDGDKTPFNFMFYYSHNPKRELLNYDPRNS